VAASGDQIAAASPSRAQVTENVHAMMQDSNDENVSLARQVEDDVALVWKSSISRADIVSCGAERGVFAEKVNAASERVDVRCCLLGTELDKRSFEDRLEILGGGVGKPIRHEDVAS
jgi:hypothetical protein